MHDAQQSSSSDAYHYQCRGVFDILARVSIQLNRSCHFVHNFCRWLPLLGWVNIQGRPAGDTYSGSDG